jgi:hypothetical protein
MLQKYKLYFNCAIVYCTKWKIFNLSTARNGKFLAFPLHEMENKERRKEYVLYS